MQLPHITQQMNILQLYIFVVNPLQSPPIYIILSFHPFVKLYFRFLGKRCNLYPKLVVKICNYAFRYVYCIVLVTKRVPSAVQYLGLLYTFVVFYFTLLWCFPPIKLYFGRLKCSNPQRRFIKWSVFEWL